MRIICLVVVSMAILAIACQKEVSGDFENKPPDTKPCLLSRVVQGTGIDDTVLVIKYDTLDRVQTIIDSAYEDSLTTTYTGNNKYPDKIEDNYGGYISITHNSKGKPLLVVASDYDTKIEMEYVADTQLSKATEYYYDLLANAWKLAGYHTVHFDSKANLTKIEEFNSSNVLISQTEIAYTDIPNPFNGLAPYNFINLLGMEDIFPAFMYLHQSKYLPKTIAEGGLVYELTYQQNQAKQVVSSVAVLKNTANNNSIEYVATRYYFYTCR